MIRAGKLDRSITIERRADNFSAAGSVSPVWSAFASVRAEIVAPETVETASAEGTAETEKLTFRLRYLAVTPADRVQYEGRPFNIVGVMELGRRRGLELTCEARA